MVFSSSFAAAAAATLLTLATANTGITVLDPVSRYDCPFSPDYSFDSPVNMTEYTDITPKKNFTLYYESNTSTAAAEVSLGMKHPSVLLEDIPDISRVACTHWTVAITFNSRNTYKKSVSTWPSSSFVIFTNNLGNCDAPYERGLYYVSGLTFNSSTNTIIASTTPTSFESCTETMDISFLTPATLAGAEAEAAVSKRDIAASFSSDFPSEITLVNDPGVLITASDTRLSGSFNLSGRVSYDFWRFKFTTFYLELEVYAEGGTTIDANATIPRVASEWDFQAADVSVSAFEIAGILSMGPKIGFGLGVDASAAGSVAMSAELGASLEGGLVHLDLLDSKESYTEGWTPVYSYDVDISGAVQAEVSPYLALTAGFGASFLSGLVELDAGLMVKSQIVNVFNVTLALQAGGAGGSNVTVPVWGNSTACRNSLGLSLSSDFVVDISAGAIEARSSDAAA
ncbi:uncharacterized protein L3040_007486 [Drepanopeziza brunnea f. sp. 'multigermtubi']|uniref:Isoamyl alcohol oxidase n=1 Tax=Marssonina brunnea f. sp. multigermtubi (strain MB_m1) TaxID=1072389 RepID=K1WZR9_MARBU|nr:isoamyl alcohol oxidase [Drepanopeziza brunnea f. sp. 'multigermtubi' MB_m1]EKD18491.1 isoamyl alcohol oxidase [Drepanopeziza brunnea f. sp. 'multigermtubi' MB_m1]KAJ5037309.1 hypothetical protein L3040_007486 [Drepanopeziza brunnea f. sp. 'multigermtubi']